jgi:hypothetical protein
MGTKIDALMNDISNNSLNTDENSMVDSIINDINGDNKQHQVPSQHQMPQISEEERKMLIQQQEQEQKMYEQQMQQQQMQQQQMQQQQMQQQQMQQRQMEEMQQQQHMQQQITEMKEQVKQEIKEEEEEEEENNKDKQEPNIVMEILSRSKETIIVFLLYLFFNLNVVQNMITIKSNSFFFNVQEGQPTMVMILVKSIFIASIFFAIQSIIAK